MRYGEINQSPIEIKSWYLEDEILGFDQPKKEDIKKACDLLNMPFTKMNAMAIMYGDNKTSSNRILPFWLRGLE